jgi:valyl-tRNA synthetase
MLEKTYEPGEIEARIHAKWAEAQAFKAGRPERADATPYSIVIPPPNVTGSLHMGHALNNTLQDVLCRFERMRGKDVLWQPGTDHAGIATQMVVERILMERQQPGRHQLGRAAFIEKVWQWKAESGGTITNQLRRLGASCDWSRERFTMDEGLSKAVLKVFVDLYNQGLIYRDKRLVNWDPEFQSALSDLEVESREEKGNYWHFRYPLKGGATYRFPIAHDEDGNPTEWEERDYIVVATTRPETMLGDTAVAVHPDDERYRALIGKTVVLPLVGREIPIVADSYADPKKGSGAVKITPAHDFNDYQVYRRHPEIGLINILDGKAQLKFQGNTAFLRGLPASDDLVETLAMNGMDRFVARNKVVERMKEKGLLDNVEQTVHAVPHAQRGDAIIEPWLTDQWYVDAAELAKRAIAVVESGETRFIPKNWEKTYFEWMRNIEPWCVSRQIWWGHQIPAWYGRKEVARRQWAQSLNDPDRPEVMAEPEIFVASSEAAAVEAARKKYNCEIRVLDSPPIGELDPIFQQVIDDELAGKPRWEPIWRDEDVLDTWFSSALWPFSTLGWPDQTKELKRFYPTSVLVTGFDIIFFWVARMLMMGLHFMKEVPFRDVYIHALVRDEKGQKMSKSKGNVMDPLDIVDGVDLDTLVRKRTSGLLRPQDAGRIAKETRKEYPQGIPAYGADALRFTLAAMAAQGRDIKLSLKMVEGNRNFATKLWNATRFAEMNGCERVPGFDPATARETVNRWIVGEVERAAAAVTAGIEGYRFNEAALAVYDFTWGTFCDWYLELTKPVLEGGSAAAQAETRATTAWALDQIMKLLHPFMPFITEELWERRAGPVRPGEELLALAAWPAFEGLADPKADEEIGWLIALVGEVRSVRSEMNVPGGAKVPLVLVGGGKAVRTRAERYDETVRRLARIEAVSFAKTPPRGAAQIVLADATAALPLAGIIDMDAERARLEREVARNEAEIAKVDARLGNEAFVAKAPPEVIEENRERKAAFEAAVKKLKAALKRLEGA